MIRHYYKILDNDNNIISDSETRKVNDGFGNIHEFIGYETKELAEFWAKDEMKLLSLDKNKHHVVLTQMNVLMPKDKHIDYLSPIKSQRSKKDILMVIHKDRDND
jgi:hypothetical protein